MSKTNANASSSSSKKAPRTGGVRFAPSPTGRFHLGNLRTAWISWRWAQILGRPWVVRVEDIDTPRVLPGARDQQLQDMAALGLVPDVLLVQSEFRSRHWALFIEGVRSSQIYACDCSRKEVASALAGIASAPHDGRPPVYTGVCRALSAREMRAADSIAWRFRMNDESGRDDFIIARSGHVLDASGVPDESTFVPAYHWACAIDDHDGGYDLLVRSADLAPAAPVQRAIQSWVGRLEGSSCEPAVFHTSLVVQDDGHRLEKRTRGVTLEELGAKGIHAAKLTQIFEQSFDSTLFSQAVSEQLLVGEANGEIKLSSLI